jgi:hypothetical protein
VIELGGSNLRDAARSALEEVIAPGCCELVRRFGSPADARPIVTNSLVENTTRSVFQRR